MPPDLLAELAQIDGIEAVKQANSAELQPIDGLAVLAGNDDIYAALPRHGRRGRHLRRLAHRRAGDAPHVSTSRSARAEIDASLRDVYETLFITASPTPVKAALNLLGHDAGTLRLPMVEADEAETAAVRAMLERHGLLGALAAPTGHALERHAARPPAGGRGRDRQEHDGRRVRRPDRRRRRRPALPDRRADGHRPRAARLRLPARAGRRHRGDRHHPRPRGPPRRAAVDPARARPDERPGHLRRPAHGRDGALQARRAQAARGRARGAPDRRGRRRRAVPDRAGPPHALDPGRLRRGAHDASSARCCSPATTSSTRRRSAARRPTCPGSPSSAARGCCCCAATPRTPTGPGLSPSESIVGPNLERVFHALRRADRRHLLRLEHPPRPAGHRRGRGARPQGRARRALDAQERQHRPLAGPHRRARGHPRPAARGRPVPRRASS